MLNAMLIRQLLPFQEPAVEAFLDRGSQLLALDPGMGKTIVAIADAEELLARRKISTCLCIVPASLKYQWAQRLAQFTDLPARQVKAGRKLITIAAPPHCIVIDGGEADRDAGYEMIGPDTEYVIIGYPNVLADWTLISPFRWEFVVLDEITAIKNPGSDISLAVKETFPAAWRLGLTGTPVENKPEELFSIMDWIEPGYLGDPFAFDKAFVKRRSDGTVMRYKNLPVLHAQLQPVMYRRKRTDPGVAPFFPREDEDTWLVPMPPALRQAYLTLARDLLDSLSAVRRRGTFDVTAAYRGGKPDESTAVGRIAAKIQAMEMLTCHPNLIANSASAYREARKAQARGADKAVWPGSKWCDDIIRSGLITADVALAACVKLNHLLDRCAQITRQPAAKTLIYTKYTRLLPILADAFALNKMSTVTYSGTMTAISKAGAIEQFTADPDCRIFLSSHAGAYGVDMFMASHLVNYDIPWSGGKAEQIDGRHVRASNQNQVIYIRHLLAQGSLDERKLAQVRFKRRLAAAIVDGRGADHLGRIENDIGTLTSFLEGLLEGS